MLGKLARWNLFVLKNFGCNVEKKISVYNKLRSCLEEAHLICYLNFIILSLQTSVALDRSIRHLDAGIVLWASTAIQIVLMLVYHVPTLSLPSVSLALPRLTARVS